MGKIIISRQNDNEINFTNISTIISFSLFGGIGGLPIGAILSGVMQNVLDDNSPTVMYGFLLLPIIIGIVGFGILSLIGCPLTDHTQCTKCKSKLQPMTQTDDLYYVPLEENQQLSNPLHFLAQNITKISSIRDIPPKKMGGYLCRYYCPKCTNRIVRIACFLPEHGSCNWKNSYYFDYQEFIIARGINDL